MRCARDAELFLTPLTSLEARQGLTREGAAAWSQLLVVRNHERRKQANSKSRSRTLLLPATAAWVVCCRLFSRTTCLSLDSGFWGTQASQVVFECFRAAYVCRTRSTNASTTRNGSRKHSNVAKKRRYWQESSPHMASRKIKKTPGKRLVLYTRSRSCACEKEKTTASKAKAHPAPSKRGAAEKARKTSGISLHCCRMNFTNGLNTSLWQQRTTPTRTWACDFRHITHLPAVASCPI